VHDVQAAGGTPLSDPAAAAEGHDPGAAPRRRIGLLLTVALVVLSLDLVTKLVAVARLADRGSVEVIDSVLSLRLVRNPGAAFGVAQGLTVVLTLIAVAVILVILRIARRLRSATWALGLGLVLGGAIGNLLDRIFRAPALFRGHVVDFVELPHWPVFNLADSAIVTGGLLMVLLSLRGTSFDGARAGSSS
jgi:signal peptidase II